MRRELVFLFAAAVLPGASAAAAEKPIVAVFDMEQKGVSLPAGTLDRLTDYLGSLLTKHGYQVVPRAQLKQRLLEEKKESYRQCYDTSCQIEIGKEMAAQKSLSSQVMKTGRKCTVTLTLFDLKRAASERAGDGEGGCDEDGVFESLKEAVAELAGAAQAGLAEEDLGARPAGGFEVGGGGAGDCPVRERARGGGGDGGWQDGVQGDALFEKRARRRARGLHAG